MFYKGIFMKRVILFFLIISLFLYTGCTKTAASYDIVATTLPVFDFTSALCENTPLNVGRLITESVSCLHDYSLQVSQMRMIEDAEMIVISGAGLEDFLNDALTGPDLIVDASANVHLHSGSHNHEDTTHAHENDPHIWLSVENAQVMATSIYTGLIENYPEYADLFHTNLENLLAKLDELQNYGKDQLSELSYRELITFHDGFGYLAESFDLTVLKAIEEESGSEASAKEIIELVHLVNDHHLPAIFTEKNGSTACAEIVSAEACVPVYSLDMAMSGNSYFEAMYHNIDTIKETLK